MEQSGLAEQDCSLEKTEIRQYMWDYFDLFPSLSVENLVMAHSLMDTLNPNPTETYGFQ